MKKLKNPYAELKGYKCFGCSPKNEQGLQMEFYEDGEYIVSDWLPQEHLQGYNKILHGGIQSTLMDEIACWVVYIKCKTAGVTTELNVKLKKTVFVNKGKIKIRAKLEEQNKRFATLHTEILDSEENICAIGKIKYFIFPPKIAKEKLAYPGIKAFFD
ncbi:MAG: PaaI family thioesterase [Bacteroidales bacterium]|jgi:uncharacterized protein (TIGR00369 family)|nr:PaaI family thioesterase [Bacteroidales bacterium]